MYSACFHNNLIRQIVLSGPSHLPHGLSIRPSRTSDKGFIENLYRATREDLRMLEGDAAFIESLIEQQMRAQQQGYGEQHPDAMYFIVELHAEPIGRLTVAMGPNEVRIVDLAFLPAAQGKGYGKGVIQALQMTAEKIPAPLSLLVLRTNTAALQLYLNLGFRAEQQNDTHLLMLWYPGQTRIITGVT